MKGSAEFDVLMIILIIASTFFVAANFLNIVNDLANALALQSAESVARDMSNFILLTSVAPDNIVINYNPSTEYTYTAKISDRFVDITVVTQNGKQCEYAFGKITVSQEICQAGGRTGVANLDFSGNGNLFTLTKFVDTSGVPKFGIEAETQ